MFRSYPRSTLFPYTTLFRSIAKYGKGKIHPFGHGRFEWIMGIFTSLAVIFMGIKLVHTSDRKSTRLNSSHVSNSYAVFCLKKKKNKHINIEARNRYDFL